MPTLSEMSDSVPKSGGDSGTGAGTGTLPLPMSTAGGSCISGGMSDGCWPGVIGDSPNMLGEAPGDFLGCLDSASRRWSDGDPSSEDEDGWFIEGEPGARDFFGLFPPVGRVVMDGLPALIPILGTYAILFVLAMPAIAVSYRALSRPHNQPELIVRDRVATRGVSCESLFVRRVR